MVDKSRFRVDKTFISVTKPEDTVEKITEAVRNRIGGYICVSNIRMVRYACQTPDYCSLMANSFMNLPDGTPLTWLGKIWGLKDIACTNGPALFQTMLQTPNDSIKHFLLGDTQEVLDEICRTYRDGIGANIVGTYSPPFVNVDDFDYGRISQMIIDSQADIVWTAMRAPKQDTFNLNLQKYLKGVMCIGVGRAFRISIGEVKQAPPFVLKLGLSGFYSRRGNLIQELGFYLGALPYLVKYITQIICWRLRGKKYYE